MFLLSLEENRDVGHKNTTNRKKKNAIILKMIYCIFDIRIYMAIRCQYQGSLWSNPAFYGTLKMN